MIESGFCALSGAVRGVPGASVEGPWDGFECCVGWRKGGKKEEGRGACRYRGYFRGCKRTENRHQIMRKDAVA